MTDAKNDVTSTQSTDSTANETGKAKGQWNFSCFPSYYTWLERAQKKGNETQLVMIDNIGHVLFDSLLAFNREWELTTNLGQSSIFVTKSCCYRPAIYNYSHLHTRNIDSFDCHKVIIFNRIYYKVCIKCPFHCLVLQTVSLIFYMKMKYSLEKQLYWHLNCNLLEAIQKSTCYSSNILADKIWVKCNIGMMT